MKAVQVQYTVKQAYVAQNKANIQKVMDRLLVNPIEGMFYSSYTLEDGQTFIHINMARDSDILSKLNDVEEFQEFRKALKESGPIQTPKATNLNLVASGFKI